MTVQRKRIRVAGKRDVKITRAGKILFPEDGITKQDLIDYYRRIASWILPHLRGRPLAMERYPDGIDKPGFFQKSASLYYPRWIKTVTIKKKTAGTVRHVVCNDAATLMYTRANQACVTPRISAHRTDTRLPLWWRQALRAMGGGLRNTAQEIREHQEHRRAWQYANLPEPPPVASTLQMEQTKRAKPCLMIRLMKNIGRDD